MFPRFRTACLTAAVVLLAGAIPSTMAQWWIPPAAQAPAAPKLVQRVYQVADLIIPIENALSSSPVSVTTSPPVCQEAPLPLSIAAPPLSWFIRACPVEGGATPCPSSAALRVQPPTLEARLMNLLTNTIQPDSWSRAGGSGTVDYYPLGMALVVNQTLAVHEQIADLLAALRRLQDVEVATEVRILSVPEGFEQCLELIHTPRAHAGQALAQGSAAAFASSSASHGVHYLNDVQVRQLLEAVQSDPRANVMQSPKLTTFNGQAATIRTTEQQFFVTNLDVVNLGGQTVFVPRNVPFISGLQLGIQPVVSPDRRTVYLNFKVDLTQMASTVVPLFPFTTFVPATVGGGAAAQPVPFTQFIQQPRTSTVAFQKTLKIADGQTVLLTGWKQPCSEGPGEQGPGESDPPVLSKLPLVGNLFKTASRPRELRNVMLLVTPRILINEEEEVRSVGLFTAATQAAAGSANGGSILLGGNNRKLAQLLEKYRQACAEGRLTEARKLAAQALRLDPACFSRNCQATDKVMSQPR